MEKPSFVSSKLGSDVPKNWKIPRFDLVGFRRKENQETKIRKTGWDSEERKPKDSCGGLPTNENPKIKIRSGGLPKNGKRRTFKIRSGGFPSVQGTEKTKDSV
ncbi:unnamed protein product [Rhizophagus irregularis]|nr:unnamed protein product [Rhizophagus irregularis]